MFKSLKKLKNLFSRKKKSTTEAVVKPVEAPKSDDREVFEYVYNQGEMTLFDCVKKSQQLGLDMRMINGKISSMRNNQFISWFKLTYLEKEDGTDESKAHGTSDS